MRAPRRLLYAALPVLFAALPLAVHAGSVVNGQGCFASTDCASGYCDGATETCANAPGQKVSNGSGCFASGDCASGYCDGATETCQPAPSGSGSASNLSSGTYCPSNSGNTATYCTAGQTCDFETGACVSSSNVALKGGTVTPTRTVTPTGAGGGINQRYLQGYKTSFLSIINGIVLPVLFAIAFVTFMIGVYNYFIYNGASEDAHEKGRTFILYAVLGFVAIISVWGLVGLVGSTLNIMPGGAAPPSPTL